MKTVKLLDCTLRDGGYINDWNFGYDPIRDMTAKLEKTGVDILELGFLKNEPYDKNRTVFNNIAQIKNFIQNKKPLIKYAAMIEVVNPIPLEMLEERTEDGIDIIRVIVWKTKHDEHGNIVDALEEGFRYCKGITEKGYRLCVQPARVDQYSDDEFAAMIRKFQSLDPMAVYVVDSWGTQNTEQVMHYIRLADEHLKREIAVGYHGHNNMMQAFGTAAALTHADLNRDLIIDSSVFGIGRGAGNLNSELFAKYMNDVHGRDFRLSSFVEIYEKYIKDIYFKHPWGFSIPYYLTAVYNCNPNYGEYYGMKKQLSATEIEKILKQMPADDRIMFSAEKADRYQMMYGG